MQETRSYLREQPLENHSVVIGLFSGWRIVWIDICCIYHHFICHLRKKYINMGEVSCRLRRHEIEEITEESKNRF